MRINSSLKIFLIFGKHFSVFPVLQYVSAMIALNCDGEGEGGDSGDSNYSNMLSKSSIEAIGKASFALMFAIMFAIFVLTIWVRTRNSPGCPIKMNEKVGDVCY